MGRRVAVLLNNVRSAHNVGSIFRTADAAGVAKIFLTGYTPRPIDRFGRVQKNIKKTALGAEKTVLWEYRTSAPRAILQLKKEGWRIVGVEQDARARNYSLIRSNKRMVFVFGNEVRGLSVQVKKLCDELAEIPMHGRKESLNVAVAAGIILFNTRTHLRSAPRRRGGG